MQDEQPKDNVLFTLSAPARRALENNGITTLEQLSKYSKKEVLNFHGMGKSSIPKLEKLLSEQNMNFHASAQLNEEGITIEIMKANIEVTHFLKDLNHPFYEEIELLRNFILSLDQNLKENIKWNGPNYCYNDEDRITMRVQPPKKQV